MISVRAAGRGDIPALIAIDPRSLTDTVRRQSIAHWTAAGQCFVAVRDERVIGYVALTRNFFHHPFIELLLVAEGDRRSGAGLALVQHCMATVPQDQKLWCSTNQSNLPMQGMMAKLGFIPSGVVENIDEGDPELFYLRRVEPRPAETPADPVESGA